MQFIPVCYYFLLGTTVECCRRVTVPVVYAAPLKDVMTYGGGYEYLTLGPGFCD